MENTAQDSIYSISFIDLIIIVLRNYSEWFWIHWTFFFAVVRFEWVDFFSSVLMRWKSRFDYPCKWKCYKTLSLS